MSEICTIYSLIWIHVFISDMGLGILVPLDYRCVGTRIS